MSDLPTTTAMEMPEPANLRFLRRLVTTLTTVMILGIIAIFVMLVIRLRSPEAPKIMFPDTIVLPHGEQIKALTRGVNYLLAITETGKIYVLDPDGQTIRKTMTVELEHTHIVRAR